MRIVEIVVGIRSNLVNLFAFKIMIRKDYDPREERFGIAESFVPLLKLNITMQKVGAKSLMKLELFVTNRKKKSSRA